jgi:hypothetical protein
MQDSSWSPSGWSFGLREEPQGQCAAAYLGLALPPPLPLVPWSPVLAGPPGTEGEGHSMPRLALCAAQRVLGSSKSNYYCLRVVTGHEIQSACWGDDVTGSHIVILIAQGVSRCRDHRCLTPRRLSWRH